MSHSSFDDRDRQAPALPRKRPWSTPLVILATELAEADKLSNPIDGTSLSVSYGLS